MALPHKHTHTHFCPFIKSFLCFVFCAVRSAGVCGQSFASMCTEGFYHSALSLTLKPLTQQECFSAGSFHMCFQRTLWSKWELYDYSLSGNVICFQKRDCNYDGVNTNELMSQLSCHCMQIVQWATTDIVIIMAHHCSMNQNLSNKGRDVFIACPAK